MSERPRGCCGRPINEEHQTTCFYYDQFSESGTRWERQLEDATAHVRYLADIDTSIRGIVGEHRAACTASATDLDDLEMHLNVYVASVTAELRMKLAGAWKDAWDQLDRKKSAARLAGTYDPSVEQKVEKGWRDTYPGLSALIPPEDSHE